MLGTLSDKCSGRKKEYFNISKLVIRTNERDSIPIYLFKHFLNPLIFSDFHINASKKFPKLKDWNETFETSWWVQIPASSETVDRKCPDWKN